MIEDFGSIKLIIIDEDGKAHHVKQIHSPSTSKNVVENSVDDLLNKLSKRVSNLERDILPLRIKHNEEFKETLKNKNKCGCNSYSETRDVLKSKFDDNGSKKCNKSKPEHLDTKHKQTLSDIEFSKFIKSNYDNAIEKLKEKATNTINDVAKSIDNRNSNPNIIDVADINSYEAEREAKLNKQTVSDNQISNMITDLMNIVYDKPTDETKKNDNTFDLSNLENTILNLISDNKNKQHKHHKETKSDGQYKYKSILNKDDKTLTILSVAQKDLYLILEDLNNRELYDVHITPSGKVGVFNLTVNNYRTN